MRNKFLTYTQYTILTLGVCLSIEVSSAAGAVDVPIIPGSADVGRIKPEQKLPTIELSKEPNIHIPSCIPALVIPEGAKAI